MGRRKDHTLVSYSEASGWSQDEYIGSRKQYWAWIDREQPQGLPKYPNRVYAEWSSWPDFLNNDNEFANANPHQYRPWNEALAYGHASGILTGKEWFAYGKHPDDIPVRPDLVYRSKGWKGWYSFLGTGPHAIAHKVSAAQQAEQMAVLAVIYRPGDDYNMVRVVEMPGVAAIQDHAKKHTMVIRGMYKLDEGYDWKATIEPYCREEGDHMYFFTNLNEALFNLSCDLLIVKV